jgi:hypothetical protein
LILFVPPALIVGIQLTTITQIILIISWRCDGHIRIAYISIGVDSVVVGSIVVVAGEGTWVISGLVVGVGSSRR